MSIVGFLTKYSEKEVARFVVQNYFINTRSPYMLKYESSVLSYCYSWGDEDLLMPFFKQQRLDSSLENLLYISCERGFPKAVKWLLSIMKPTLTIINRALIKACSIFKNAEEKIRSAHTKMEERKVKQAKIVEQLLSARSTLQENSNDSEAFLCACKSGLAQCAKLLIESGFDPSNSICMAFDSAVDWESDDVAEYLLSLKIGAPLPKNILLLRACEKPSRARIVRVLVKHKDVNVEKALEAACFAGNSEAVRIILASRKVKPDVRKGNALKKAMKRKHREIVRLLLSYLE